MQEMPRVLKATELMDYLRISRTTFDKLAPQIPGVFKVGTTWRFPLEGVLEWQRRGGTVGRASA